MNLKTITASSLAVMSVFSASGGIVAQFPMDVRSGQIVESVSKSRFGVQGHFAPENLPGAVGQALRFDGYTSYIEASIGNILPAGSNQMTVSVWVAVPCYPIIKIDEQTNEKTAIVSSIDETTRTGFGFFLGFDGKWSFRTYIGGWPLEITVDTPLPVYQWNCLTAVIDGSSRKVTVYNNGVEVGSSRCNGAPNIVAGKLRIGHGTLENFSGPFLLTSFNGLIDDITIWDEALTPATIASWEPENPADLDIPASRYADDILRPRFHGMPATAWTNECHGLVYSGGRYHLFFQKNANGPYMARLHWGHISSENLYDWREEPIAIAPGDRYDIKGCWSGCVFTDEVVTGGRPNIIYTGVDYGQAMIAQATPDDIQLIKWTKKSNNPIIPGRPSTMDPDFRDPYFFRSGDNAYIIVGGSRGGVGTTSLHRYNPTSGTWSNDGSLFFSGTNAAIDGNFWEMPNITPMASGKWLFTATPLSTSTGTRTIFWTGSISADGKFIPDTYSSSPRQVELISRQGFGLLSPTIYNHDGKTIALGIVPDKLGSQENWNLGWAHCYSLPREWSLNDNGELIQRPWESLTGMRSATSFSRSDLSLNGTLALDPVGGREVELCGTFTVGSTPFGFNIFKNATASASITYTPSRAELTIDFSRLNRLVNDGGVYDGVYRCTLPERPRVGESMKINVFIDHSIVDIFINDRWATSIRVFPTDSDADGVEVFATDGNVTVSDLKAWILSPEGGNQGVDDIDATDTDTPARYYNLQGVRMEGELAPGIYICRRGNTASKIIIK